MSGNGKQPAFATYRLTQAGGDAPDDLGGALGQVLEAHARRWHGNPARLVVNPSQVERARAALAALGQQVDVAGNGGCLAWECWTEVGNGHRPRPVQRSALADVAAAQVEMTPARARELLAEQLSLTMEVMQ